MFRDEFDPGGVVERVEKSGIRYTLPLFLVCFFFQLSLSGEKEGKKKEGKKGKKRRN